MIQTTKGRLRAALGAVLLGAGIAIAVPVAANADSGNYGCGSNYGFNTVVAHGAMTTHQRPPGSDFTYIYAAAGTRTYGAVYADGQSKPGGGYWSVNGAQIRSFTNFCRSFG